MEKKKIEMVMILEIIGFPKEHLISSLKDMINLLRIEESVKITDEKISEPTLVKDQKQFYTSFAEVNLEVEDMMHLVMLLFKYMPSNIEIITPEQISLSNSDWSEILSEMTRQLHKYDEIARVLELQKKELGKRVVELTKKSEKK